MTEPTELPVDALARLRVAGARRAEALALATERVRTVQPHGDAIHVIFEVRHDGYDHGIRQVVLERIAGMSIDTYEVTGNFTFRAPTPEASRTGGATAGMDLRPMYGPPRPTTKVLPPKPVRDERPMPKPNYRVTAAPAGRSSKLSLDPGRLAGLMRDLAPSHHAALYARLVADHGRTIAAPAWIEAHARYMRRPVKRAS